MIAAATPGERLCAAWAEHWGGSPAPPSATADGVLAVRCPRERLVAVCEWLVRERGLAFAALVVEERGRRWRLGYLFHGPSLRVEVALEAAVGRTGFPSISSVTHAADWHEREVEDLFGLHFEGHPKLGDFVLHEDWPEGVNPMRRAFDGHAAYPEREVSPQWTPPAIVEAQGVFRMPVGPVYSDFAEAAHFQLETVGEDVIVATPRLFYKYRGVEKRAEGATLADALLLAERFSGTSAFAHALALCQAAEAISGCQVPPRGRWLRTVFAELERLRHHVAVIAGLCQSTALAVAAAQAAMIEERLLRLSARVGGHRYLFGVACPGGVNVDLDGEHCALLAAEARAALEALRELARGLGRTGSFLDRIEEVGVIDGERARAFGMVGPPARAAGCDGDLRKRLPYAAYAGLGFETAAESEGDGYARLRVLLTEAEEALGLIESALACLPDGPAALPWGARAGASWGAVEAPGGATFHFLRLDRHARVARYRIAPPAFANWHGFHLAAENFAFQDFPIILASFGLSVAECDR